MTILNDINNIDFFIELLPDLAFIKDMKGRYTHCNKNFLDFINQKKENIINKTDFEIFTKENAQRFYEADKEVLKSEKKEKIEELFIHENSSISYFETTKEPLFKNGKKIALFCVAKNITQEKEYEIIYNDNKYMLEYIAIENKLSKILDKIVKLAEKRNSSSMCSILLLDKSKKHLLKGSAPSLPTFYNNAINGVKIGEKIGSCGSAAFKKERVIVEDINKHENWQAYLELTRKANLHACWSEPIFSSNNEILGTFAIYNNKPKAPSNFELKSINAYAHLASIAIEKINTQKLFIEQQNELLKSKSLTRNIVDAIPDLVWLKDAEGKYLLCNPEFEKFFGAKEKDIVGKTDYDFVEDELANFFRENDKKAMKTSKGLVNEEWVNYKNHSEKILLDTTKKAFYGINGDIMGVLGIGHNVTQRYKKEKELKKLNNLAKILTNEQSTLLSLFEKGNQVLFKWKNNENWKLEYVSSSIENFLDYDKEEFLSGKIDFFDTIHKDDLKNLKSEIKNAIKYNLDYFKHKIYRVITKENQIKYVLDSKVTQKNSRGKITHFIGYITDITEQKQQEEMINQQSKMLSLVELLGNISHQWRQPLSIITTIATGSKLEKELGILDDDNFYKNMDLINENAQYLSKIIDNFRNFITKDRKKTDYNLTKSIDSYLTILSSIIEENNIKIIKNTDDSIIMSNFENDVKKTLLNITSNCIEALKKANTNEKYIFITTKKDDNDVTVTIEDNAGGINENILDTIFEPYTTSKYNSLGTGLGLNIAYNCIVNINKGFIKAENRSFIYDDKIFTGAKLTITLHTKI